MRTENGEMEEEKDGRETKVNIFNDICMCISVLSARIYVHHTSKHLMATEARRECWIFWELELQNCEASEPCEC